MNSDQKPSVGRIVHYVSYGTPGGEYQPSKDGGFTGHISLAVLNPEGMFFNKSVLQDEEHHAGGTWHWPERDA